MTTRMNTDVAVVRRIALLVDRWHWVVLGLAAPLLLFPTPARSPALLAVLLVWVAGWVARPRQPLAHTPFNGAVLLMWFMVLVSVVVTPDLAFSLPKVAGMVLAVAVFFAMARAARHRRSFMLGLALFLATGAGVAGLSLIGTDWIAKYGPLSTLAGRLGTRLTELPGAAGGGHPNEVAGALLWVAPAFVVLPAAFAPGAWRNGRRLLAVCLLFLGALLTMAILVLTQSRSAYVALALTALVMLLLALPRRARWVLIACLAVLSVLAALLVWHIGPAGVAAQVVEKLATPADATGLAGKAASRVEIWSRALYAIEDFPLTGMGMNMFRRLVHPLYPMLSVGPDFDIGHAHNEFLQAALDLGLPGLAAFVLLYGIAFRTTWRAWRAARSRGDRALALGLGGGLFAHLIYGMTDAVALGAKPGILFWMLLGLISGLMTGLIRPPISAAESAARPAHGLRPRSALLARFVKRAADIAGATLGLVVSAPVIALAALAVKLDSPGPAFFVQERAGEHGRPFRIVKLRTMVAGAEQRQESLLPFNSLSGPSFKMKADPRVTRVGRVLRRWSIDELPQFWNVLRGEMSLVGPRPDTLRAAALYDERQRLRLLVKPGMTGPMQVAGRGALDLDARVELELCYVERRSVLDDLSILARTLPAVLSGRGAY
jgi:lipopolysaccharide/colanic/teichoic acid biosynthesis glycosyltransferase